MTFDEWLRTGMDCGWCGPAVCSTHDGTPTSADEDNEFDDGYDPCIPIVRLYENMPHIALSRPSRSEIRAAVESNHSPSLWRKL